MEGRLVANVLARIAESDGLDQVATQRIRESMVSLEQVFDGLGFCLSEERDLLSQWRGYAADASGVAIGFTKEYLDRLADMSRAQSQSGFTLQRVEYEPENQEALVRPTYQKVKASIENGAFKIYGGRGLLDSRSDEEIEEENKKITDAYKQLLMTMLALFSKLFLLKAKAFREECEWRLISHLVNSGEDECSYRPLHDRIVPYRKFPLLELDNLAPISEVILGPKNITPTFVIENFLKQSGFVNVRVLRSEATYR